MEETIFPNAVPSPANSAKGVRSLEFEHILCCALRLTPFLTCFFAQYAWNLHVVGVACVRMTKVDIAQANVFEQWVCAWQCQVHVHDQSRRLHASILEQEFCTPRDMLRASGVSSVPLQQSKTIAVQCTISMIPVSLDG